MDVLQEKDKKNSSAESSDKKIEKSLPEETEESIDEQEKVHEEEPSVKEVKEKKKMNVWFSHPKQV